MTEHEFTLWWSDQTDTDIIGFFFNINKLPGTLASFKERKNLPVLPGIMQREENDPKAWTPLIYAHINDVDDSYIELGTNRISRRYTPRRGTWKDMWHDWQLKKQKRFAERSF